ncbi:MAG: hypothetical protein ACOC7X_07160 [Spirochaetota bacterium]
MKSKLPKKYYFIPIIYVILILGFIHLHLQDIGGRVITKSLGPVTVRYRQETGVRQQLSHITVSLDGLSADLSAGVPVEDATGRSDYIPIRSVESTQNGFRLILARGGSLELMVRDGNAGFSILYHKDTQDDSNFVPLITLSAPPEIEVRQVHRSLPLIELRRDSGSLLLVHNDSVSSVAEGLQLKFNPNDNGMMLSQVAASNGLGISGIGDGSDAGGSADGSESGESETRAGDNQIVMAGFVAAPLPPEANPLAFWYFGDQSSPSSAMAEKEVQRMVKNMLDSWQRSPNQVDEWAVAATAAESMASRNSVDFGALQPAADVAAEDSAWHASTFVDNIVNAEQSYAEREVQLLQEISRLIGQNPEQLLAESVKGTNYPGLLSSVVFAGDRELERQLDQTLSEMDVQAIESSAAAAGLFILAVEALDRYPRRFSRLAGSVNRAYERVLAHIIQVESQLLYRSFSNATEGNGVAQIVVDPLLQVKLARALQRFGLLIGADQDAAGGAGNGSAGAGSDSGTGDSPDSNSLSEVVRADEGSPQALALRLGYSLMVSAVSFADQSGALPAEVTADANGLVSSDSRLSPSRVYSFLPENTFYPRVVSLEKELDQNIRLWTSAQVVGAEQRADGFEISLEFAVDETHYLVMRGVDPFEAIQMYGQSWNGDWRFQTYNVGGWFYNRQERTLFMKIRHRDKIERLIFTD